MPCWEVRLVSVEFKAKHIDLLEEVATRLKLSFTYNERSQIVSIGGIRLNLKEQKAEIEDRSSNYSFLSTLKREYSKTAIEKIAKKKKWILKANEKNPKLMQLKKW